jgi:hypothetical protein
MLTTEQSFKFLGSFKGISKKGNEYQMIYLGDPTTYSRHTFFYMADVSAFKEGDDVSPVFEIKTGRDTQINLVGLVKQHA